MLNRYAAIAGCFLVIATSSTIQAQDDVATEAKDKATFDVKEAMMQDQEAFDEATKEEAEQDNINPFAVSPPAPASGYWVCAVPGTNRPEIHCNGCPRGTTLVSYNSGSHPTCSNSRFVRSPANVPNLAKTEGCEKLYDISHKGWWPREWKGGHKSNWCRAAGFDFISRNGSSYNTGNYCFTGQRSACGIDIGN